MPLPETISRLRKQHHVTQEPLSEALGSVLPPFPNGSGGYHLDKDTTPIPR